MLEQPVAASYRLGALRSRSFLQSSYPHRDKLSSVFTADGTHTIAFWLKCLNRFHFFVVTTLPTEVPRVSIGRRVSPISPVGSRYRYKVLGLHTLKSAAPRRMPLHPSIAIQMESYWTTLPPVSGRTQTASVSTDVRSTEYRPEPIDQDTHPVFRFRCFIDALKRHSLLMLCHNGNIHSCTACAS